MSERSTERSTDPASVHATERVRELLDSLYRVDSGRILATLIRLLGDFDLAEEAMHEAFAAALSVWPKSGVPGNPRPWLISTARFKAIDTLRRRARFDASQGELAHYLEAQSSSAESSNNNDGLENDGLEDDRLRLIFTCCHPLSRARSARGAHLARSVRADHRGNRKGFPHHSGYARATHRARKNKNSRDTHSGTKCRRRRNCRSGWTRCCRSSISYLMRATPLQRERKSRAPN